MAAEARIGQIRKFFIYGRRETYDSSNESYQRPQYDSNVKTAKARVFVGLPRVSGGFSRVSYIKRPCFRTQARIHARYPCRGSFLTILGLRNLFLTL